MVVTVLESHVLHSAGSIGSLPSGTALPPTLAVHLLQQSLLQCWAMDVPAVCVGSWMGALGALPGRRGGKAAVQTEGLCSEGCWALGKLKSHKAACVQEVPTAWWDGSLLPQASSWWAQAGPVVSSPAFLPIPSSKH